MTRRTQLVCNSPDSLLDETDYKRNYNMDFVRRNTHSNTDSGTQRQLWPCYDSDYTTETIARTLLCILQPYNIHVAPGLSLRFQVAG